MAVFLSGLQPITLYFPCIFHVRVFQAAFLLLNTVLTQACVTAAETHGELADPLPLHVQNQINRGKEDLPVFLRVLLVAFVRYSTLPSEYFCNIW